MDARKNFDTMEKNTNGCTVTIKDYRRHRHTDRNKRQTAGAVYDQIGGAVIVLLVIHVLWFGTVLVSAIKNVKSINETEENKED